ncbi:uncharacterized protein [Aristolochia californica]|uniref:uncharacterized protein n=1 Tax=Aristolochia californica TaxID=171875 RepID=UPI0035E12DA9
MYQKTGREKATDKHPMDLPEADVLDPNPDVHELFCYYNSLYFQDALGACILSWSSQRMTLTAGVCHYLSGGGCEIRLSEPLLKFRPSTDLKNTLLHEMIHAYLWITNNNKDHNDHGQTFQRLMEEINSSTVVDHLRPGGGYNITIYHSFHDEVDNYRVHHWMCQSCGDLIKRAMNRAPSASDCTERIGHCLSCGNPSCHWHRHKMTCSGSFKKIAEPPGYNEKRKRLKGKAESLQSDSSKAAHHERSAQEAKVKGSKDYTDVERVKTIDNFFHSVGNPNGKSDRTSPPCDDPEGSISCYEFRASERNSLDHGKLTQTADLVGRLDVPQKRPRTPLLKTDVCTKQENNYNVIIAWLAYYSNEEDEEAIEPLHNKRTERRKKPKLAKTEIMESNGEVKSFTGDPNNQKMKTIALGVDDKEVSDAYLKNAEESHKDLITAKSTDCVTPRPGCKGKSVLTGCSDESDKEDIVYISDG